MKRIVIITLLLVGALAGGCFAGFKMSQYSLSGMSLSYINDAQKYFKEKDYVRATAYFNKATALDPNSFIAHISLADTYYVLNNFPLALEEYEIALTHTISNNERKYIEERIEKLKVNK